jgi:hypothetical protein
MKAAPPVPLRISGDPYSTLTLKEHESIATIGDTFATLAVLRAMELSAARVESSRTGDPGPCQEALAAYNEAAQDVRSAAA